jgi:integrase/recombinase XerD
MKTLREQFIQQMELKGYSNLTIKSYTEMLVLISKHYKQSPDFLTTQQIRNYLSLLVEKKRSQSYVNQLISALKILHEQVLKKEWDAIAVPRMKRPKKLPVVLSKQEVIAILNATKNIKHKTILMVTYSTGLRMSETINLRVEDIDSGRMQLRIKQAKGAKDRYGILSQVLLEQLRFYFKTYKPKDWLFPSQLSEKISGRTVQQIFKAALKKANILKKVSIHSLRHSFATHMMEQGVSLPIIQQLLGHKSLRTTSVYLHVQQYTLDKIKSPLDSLSL